MAGLRWPSFTGKKRPVDREVLTQAAIEPDRRWAAVLVNFMRLVAVAWLVKGLLAWALILGMSGGTAPFEGRTVGNQAATVYFAVLDVVAATGLWLASSWGGVLWMLAVMSHLILAVFFPRFVSNGAVLLAIFIFSVTAYLILSWLASVDE